MSTCMHEGCVRRAVRVVSYERPNHREFVGQTHECCAVHSRERVSSTWADLSSEVVKDLPVSGFTNTRDLEEDK